MFMLVWRWINEKSGELYEEWIDCFDTKQELTEAYHNSRMKYIKQINIGRLILSPAISCTWSDIEEKF